MPLLNQTIKFVIIKNPFVPDARLVVDRDYESGKSLHDYIGDLNGQFTIVHNGAGVEMADLPNIYPIGGDVIGIAPVPAGGGGGGKDILRLVAVVALAVVTAGAAAAIYGGALAAGGLFAAGSMSAAMLAGGAAAVIGIGGNLLINKLLPPTVPTVGSSSTATSSSSYGIDGAKNTSTEGVATPVIYGTFRTAGNIIANHTTMDGQDQWLHLLINAGEGVISTFDSSTVLINDQQIDDFGTDAKVSFVHGNAGQNCFAEFSAQITPNQVTAMRDIEKEADWSYFETAAGVEVEAVEIGLISQIYRIDDNGNQVGHSVDVQVDFRKYGSTDEGDWAGIQSGIKHKYAGQGWVFGYVTGVKGIYDPGNHTVTKQKIGSQLIDASRPNKYHKETGTYQNYYELVPGYFIKQGRKNVWVPDSYVLRGEAVTPRGSTVSKITGYYSRQYRDGDMEWHDTTNPEDQLAQKTKENTDGLISYDYGHLIVDDQIVGHYHDFHQSNKSVTTYNGNGIELGAKATEKNITLSGSTSAANRYFFRSPRLSEGRYEIRVRRIGDKSTNTRVSESIVFNEVNEIVYADVDYNYTALLWLSIKATSNISSVPKVTFVNCGRVIRVWDDRARRFIPSYNSTRKTIGTKNDYKLTEWEKKQFPFLTAAQNAIYEGNEFGGNIVPNVLAWDMPAHILVPSDQSRYNSEGFYGHSNPAWIVYDMLTDRRVGGGLSPTRLDFWAFKEWADYCESKKLYFNGVFDATETLWDQIAKVFRVGRANPIRIGTRYSVAIEKPSLEVMRFGQDNIKEGSFSVNWLSVADRANEVEVTFYDKKYDYKQRVIKVYDQTALANGEKAITSPITLVGVTDYDQAVREANFALNANKLVETVSFVTSVSSLACTVGDVVRVQHNMMDWGEAGKLLSVTELPNNQYSLKLDHPIQFDTDNWSVLVHYDFASKGSFVVKSKADSYITLTGMRSGATNATRVMVNGKDVAILNTFSSSDGSGDYGIVTDNPGLFSVGNTVELFVVNTYETATLTPSTLSGKTDIVLATMNTKPAALSSFMIGKTNFASKLFKVKAISLANDTLERVVTALEYDERVYNDENTNFQITEDSAYFALGPVSDVTISEVGKYENNVEKIELVISWSHSDERYKDAAVYVSTNRTRETSLGRHIANARYTVNPSDDISIRIVPYNAINKTGTAKSLTYSASDTTSSIASSKPVSGVIDKTAGGSKISVVTANAIGVKQIEMWAIVEGTLINGVAINSTLAAALTGAQVEEVGKLLGYASETGEFIHVAETETNLSKSYYYFSRAVSYANEPSDVTYIGVSKPVSSITYNTVTVYCLSATTPPTPTGGTYENHQPDGELWKQTPPVRAEGDTVNELWVSSRRFCNFIESQDPVWSTPSAITTPVPDVTGQILQTWVAYASSPVGGDFSHTYDPTKHTWRGVSYNHKKSEPVSDNSADYTWQLIVTLTDIMNSSDRAAVNALAEGKTVNGDTIAINTAVTSQIATAVGEAMSRADTQIQSVVNYVESTNSVNWLKNASLDKDVVDANFPNWSLVNNFGLNAVTELRRSGDDWSVNGTNTSSVAQIGSSADPNHYIEIIQDTPVSPGVKYGFSAYTGAHRCDVSVFMFWMDYNGLSIGNTPLGVNRAERSGGGNLNGYMRNFSYGVAPAGAYRARCVIRKGNTYSGQPHSFAFFLRAQFGEWGLNQETPPDWCPGDDSAIVNNQIIAPNIATGAITSTKIATGAVDASKTAIAAINAATGQLNDNTVSANQIIAEAVTSVELANNAVTAAKTAIAAINSATGDLQPSTVSSVQLALNAVTNDKISSGAVTASKTSIAAIDAQTGNLSANTVGASQILNNAVNSLKIAAGAVDASKTSIAAINAATGQLNGGTVGVNQIVDNAISETKIVSGAITASKLNIQIGGGNLLRNSGFEWGDLSFWGNNAVDSVSVVGYRSLADSKCLRLQSYSDGDRYIVQVVPAQPNTKYTFSAWVYVESVATGVSGDRSVLIYDLNGNSNSENSLSSRHEIGKWVKKTTSFTTGPSANYVEVRLYAPVGVVYWDCAQLEQGDVSTSYAPKVGEIAPSSIDSSMLANSAITDVKIAAAAVSTNKLSVRKHLIY